MTWEAATDTDDVSFLQAVDWFAQRVPITAGEFERGVEQARRQAFWIAGVTQAEIIRDVHDSLKRAIDKGVPFEEWQREIGPTLERAWIGQTIPEGQAARTETILRNWAQSSYGRARHQQMNEPAITRLRPYRMFDAVRDEHTSEICGVCDGTILPADHPWWNAHQPPLHHRCRSGIRSLRASKAEALGITEVPTDVGPQEGFGSGDEYQGPDRKKFPTGAKPPPPPPPAPPPPPREVTLPKPKRPRKTKPGRPLGKFSVGVHASALEVDPSVPDELATAALEAFTADDLKALQKRPLRRLRLQHTADADGRVVSGWYSSPSADLAVTMMRSSATYGQTMRAGETWSVSAAAKTPVRAVQRTLIHELGHHLHRSLGREADEIVKAAFATHQTSGPVTKYAGSNRFEYFAESFAAYRYYPNTLQAHDPVGHQMVVDVLRLHDIEP